MSDVYTPDPSNNPTGITLALDGDPKSVDSLRVGIEGVADMAKHAQWPENNATKKYPLASRSITRWKSIASAAWASEGGGGASSHFRYDTSPGRLTQWLFASASKLMLPLDLPNGCTLTSVIFPVTPDPGHTGIPSVPIEVVLYSINVVTGSLLTMRIATDTTASLPAYIQRHIVPGLTGMAFVIDTTANVYFLEYTGESGSDSSTVQLDAYGVTYTVTEQDPGAA